MGITRVIKGTALAAGIMLLGVAAACGGGDGGSSGPDSLVPQRASVVGSLAVAQALDAFDLDLDQFSEMFSSGSPGEKEGPEGFNTLFNIDQFRSGGLFGDISRADIFGEITDGDDVEYFAVLLHGSFDEDSLIAKLESVFGHDLAQRVYKGAIVYSPADDADEFALSVLDSSTFVMGIGGAINDVIDIKAGDADPASGALMDTFNDLSGGLFGFALKVPQDIADEADLGSIPGLGDLPISLDFISALDIVGLGGDLDDGSLDLVVTMDFTDEKAAESLEAFISGIVTLASGFLSDPRTSGILGGLEIDRDGSRLTIKVSIPTADIPGLFGDLTTGTSFQSSAGTSRGVPETRLLEAAVRDKIAIMPSALHVAEGQKVEYSTTPPTSGDHWARWADCGWYPGGLPDEVVTHNLEHGNIVVSYNFANPAQVTELRQALEATGLFKIWGVARSHDKIADGEVALSAWGRVHFMEGVRTGEIGLFFETFAGKTGPERIAC